jgi:hypothetical protein
VRHHHDTPLPADQFGVRRGDWPGSMGSRRNNPINATGSCRLLAMRTRRYGPQSGGCTSPFDVHGGNRKPHPTYAGFSNNPLGRRSPASNLCGM